MHDLKYFYIFLVLIFSAEVELFANTNEPCRKNIEFIEKELKLPNKLLVSISLTETGRNFNGKFQTWPWSLNVSGKTHYFANKIKMKTFLMKKLKSNITNIDIGCMQINYKYHINDLSKVDFFLDPYNNVKWGGDFLKRLYERHKSWNMAISRYHSSDKVRQKKYLTKVYKNWKVEREKKSLFLKKVKKPDKIINKSDSSNLFTPYFFSKNKKKIEYFKELFKKNPRISL